VTGEGKGLPARLSVALLQMDTAWEDVAENHRRADAMLRDAAARGAELAVLPEMFSTGFSMSPERIAEAEGGPSERFLLDRARSLGIAILGSVPQKAEPRPKNVALLALPSGEIVRYAKIHPFTFGGEARHYSGGDRVVTATVGGVRVTPFVCYDLRFPEPFRVAAPDTDLFVVVANWPDARREHWRVLLRARAIENQAYVVGVNRAGEGGGLRYAGDSVAIDPLGETLAEATPDAGQTTLIAEIDPAVVANARVKFPALTDVRPEAYRR
jgi:predicted amidohydrolase